MIGLTGGIGSGKSTVAALLKDLGVTVVDADQAAREVVEPGTEGFGQVIAEFGSEFAASGRLDRARLARLVFADEEARRRLEAITHPLVRLWMAERTAEAAARGELRVVYEVPLLYEGRLEAAMEAVVVVWVPEEVQVRRLVEGQGYDRAHARARIAAQMPIDLKRSLADHVIDNSGSLESTRRQTLAVWTRIAGQIAPSDRS